MPASLSGVRVRTKRARSWRAWKVSSTRIRAPAGGAGRSSCTTAAAAPRARRVGDEAVAVRMRAGEGEEGFAPADGARIDRRALDHGVRGRRPSPGRRPRAPPHRPTAEPKRSSRALPISSRSENGSFCVADRLLPLVPLAGHHHRPAGLGGGDRLADRLAPVRHQAVASGCRSPSSPSSTAARMASGSSLRGLSEVAITRSASSPATLPISGRLPASRSPPQPKTTATLPPPTTSRAERRAASRAASVWA